MKKLGKLNLKAEKMLSHEELVSFKGGSDWDGECGWKVNGEWECSSSLSYDDVTYAYDTEESVTGWCCASCSEKC